MIWPIATPSAATKSCNDFSISAGWKSFRSASEWRNFPKVRGAGRPAPACQTPFRRRGTCRRREEEIGVGQYVAGHFDPIARGGKDPRSLPSVSGGGGAGSRPAVCRKGIVNAAFRSIGKS